MKGGHSIFERRHLIEVCPGCGDFPTHEQLCVRCGLPADQVWVRIVLATRHDPAETVAKTEHDTP